MTKNNNRLPSTTPTGKVYDFILRSGNAGVTDEDIYNGVTTGLTERADRHRRGALARAGLIVKTGALRITSKNRPAAVWKAKVVVDKVAARR